MWNYYYYYFLIPERKILVCDVSCCWSYAKQKKKHLCVAPPHQSAITTSHCPFVHYLLGDPNNFTQLCCIRREHASIFYVNFKGRFAGWLGWQNAPLCVQPVLFPGASNSAFLPMHLSSSVICTMCPLPSVRWRNCCGDIRCRQQTPKTSIWRVCFWTSDKFVIKQPEEMWVKVISPKKMRLEYEM